MALVVQIVNIIFLAACSYLLVRKSVGFKFLTIGGLALKIISGILLGWLYMYYYGYGDTLTYFKEAAQLADLALTSPTNYLNFLNTSSEQVYKSQFVYEPRALFFTKITSVFCLVSANNYWIVASYFSLLSFYGAWVFARLLIKHYPAQKLAILLSLFFIPSVVFWSSGIIKESMSFFLICVLSTYVVSWVVDKKYRITDVLAFAFFFFLLWKLKYYYAGVFISVALTLLFATYLSDFKEKLSKSKVTLAGIYIVFLVVIVMIVTLFHPNLGLSEIHGVIVRNYQAYAAQSSPGNYIVFDQLNDVSGFILSVPKALISGLYRPFIWEAQSSLMFFQGIECLILFLLTISRLIYFPKQLSNTEFLMVVSCLMFIIITVTFLAFSAPNYGTLSRYKSALLPFLGFILLFNHPILN
ncbi:MAG: hypothetical protein RLO81_03280, partial [Fulvivirga sp.]|uniref:hypothetical protein n=1 Tax=Fulvivirga sp. TaxID=1931237 RepID=UPI0032EAE72B